ncbi:MAG TPA: membrane protein insertase YidC [Xanthomonadaceae bacterium]|jgi:YidC/Oxa1 family membrane protein insertase|nr:membrane protein insertase YidC [Xanthomonadaceae bacterium]
MNQTRTLLAAAWLILAFWIWQDWQQDHAPPQTGSVNSNAANDAQSTRVSAKVPKPAPAVPTASPALSDATTTPAMPSTGRTLGVETSDVPAAPPVTLGNDVLRLRIDPHGASIVGAELLAYGQTTSRNSTPVKLLDSDPTDFFVAESGIVSAGGHAPNHLSVFQVERSTADKSFAQGSDSISQSLLWSDPSGVQVRKTFTLKRGSYVIDVQEEIRNGGATTWIGNDYRQLRRVPPIIKKSGGLTNFESYAFVGAAWFSPEDRYETRALTKYDDPLDKSVTGGWMAMVQHYFLAAWIPDPKEPEKLSIDTDTTSGSPIYRILATGPAMQVPAGGSRKTEVRLYVGPELQNTLPSVAPGLELTVDYGWFKIFAGPLFWLLSKLHWLFGNWGWSIVALVLLIKLAMFKLSEAQYKSMAKMRAIQPRLEALKERYGDDKQQYQLAMMELYKKEKINPAGGCLPALVQIPIFFALYRVLLYSVELRHAPWFGWIHSLSEQDPYFVLPVLYTISMIATQRLTPSPGMDPMQKKMMQVMPLVMGVMFAVAPAGLALYWVISNTLGLVQQWWLMRKHGVPGVVKR